MLPSRRDGNGKGSNGLGVTEKDSALNDGACSGFSSGSVTFGPIVKISELNARAGSGEGLGETVGMGATEAC